MGKLNQATIDLLGFTLIGQFNSGNVLIVAVICSVKINNVVAIAADSVAPFAYERRTNETKSRRVQQ